LVESRNKSFAFEAAAVRTISLRKTASPALSGETAPESSLVTSLMTAAVDPIFCSARAVSPATAKAQSAIVARSACRREMLNRPLNPPIRDFLILQC
jgi:hypothetical protein